jgi:DNA-binding GntR family transcriptional regulator
MTVPKKEACYSTLKRRILTLALAPGTPLDENTLSAEFGVSRTPLREVLQRLAGEGCLSLEQNRGAQVASMDLRVMHDFFQTAPMIYAATSRMAAENATPRDVAILRDIQAGFVKALKDRDPSEATMRNHAFHDQIGVMAANPFLTPSLNRLLIDHARMGRTFYRAGAIEDQARIDAAQEQHDRLIDAIEAREPAPAVKITLEHWELSRNEIERYVRPDPFPTDPGAYEGSTADAL